MPRKKSSKKHSPPPSFHSEEEIADLGSFCAEVNHIEIPFEQWQSCHVNLNLHISVFLSFSELSKGTEKIVNFSRTTKDENGRSRRELASMTVSVPPGAVVGQIILFREQGDRLGSLAGDLVITLQCK